MPSRATLAFILLLTGCLDKAKADYDKCLDRERNYDVPGAVAACQAAVAADPKSTSGEAAAKKLVDLQTVSAKMKTEADEKSQREASIKKDEPPLVVVHSAAPVASGATLPPGATPYAQAQALMAAGDSDGARKIIQPRAWGGTASSDEMRLLLKICKQQKDKLCLQALAKAGIK